MRKIEIITDVMGNYYPVITFNSNSDIIKDYLKDLANIVGKDFDKFTSNQQLRDNRKNSNTTHHITIFNPMEVLKLQNNSDLFDKMMDEMRGTVVDDLIFHGIGKGIGKGSDGGVNKTYFIVCESNTLNRLRAKYVFPYKDLHITLGFDEKDVFGISKGMDSLI